MFYRIIKLFLAASTIFTALNAEILYESGSLKEFIGGTSPQTQYDNYVSHISEGIASEGYNDYGPNWLDVQTNEFGNYQIIPSDSETLTHWQSIFTAFNRGNINLVDQFLTDSLAAFNYDVVEFQDTVVNRTFYMIRERLDSSFVDVNMPMIPEDDVVGSFRNGWGIFIINPAAQRQNIVIEVPHPCDDFIAPYLATNLFLETDAYAMTIAGAGREVEWTNSGNYSNNKSKSDPSRNTNTPFHLFHKVLSDSLLQTPPHSPLVLHMHSFDDNSSHEGFKSIVLSAGWDAGYANKPVRDVTNDHLDFVNFTTEYPTLANAYGDHDAEHVTDFYQVHYSGSFFYYGETQDYPIPHTSTLLGPNTGVQMNYLRQFTHSGSVYEPWIQVEFFEKPMLFTDLEMPNEELYPANYPTSWQNYGILLDYFQPFVDAVDAYLTNWESVPDTTAPPQINNFHATYDGYHYEALAWSPVEDTNFETYRIYFDPDSVTENSPYLDVQDDSNLQDMRTNHTTITGLDENLDYQFKVNAIDYFENAGVLSESIADSIPGQISHTVIENFDDGTVDLQSYEDEDLSPTSWSLSTTTTYLNSNRALYIWGNTWKTEDIDPYPISDGTVWQIACRSQSSGEIHGFGVRDSVNMLVYSFNGSELLNIEEWNTVYQGYFPNYSWNLYQLPIADDWFARFEYFPSLTSLVFINDRDDDLTSSVVFDEIIDITPVLDIMPEVSFTYTTGALTRTQSGERNVDVSFTSFVNDPDNSYHTYFWQFGDGETSGEHHPTHTFIVEDDHPYTVLLQVMDSDANWGQFAEQITIDPGESSFPLTLNFVGDIMLARRYEDNDGIIDTAGVNSIFEPTLEVLGEAADITVANLECPFTVYGTVHPTKSIVFKSHPDNLDGLEYAGIDIVTLANNHSEDYGLTGLDYTQYYLGQREILYSGAGADSYEAYLPLFYNQKGLNLAFLATSDRTGQYNNFQPYLNAGYNKSGFAYMTPYYIQQQIENVQETADLIILELHAGSEYSISPGSDYDSFIFDDILDPQNYEAPRDIENNWDIADISDEEENYSPELDMPQMWDREIRHFAIDSGADLVIVHHPHIIQGVEVYNGKVIAHSLGNYIFDLNYPETYPTMILNASADDTGFYEFSITPAYIDDYIPQVATGELGLHLLDYIAFKSRELDSYLFVDRFSGTANVVLDTLSNTVTQVTNRQVPNITINGNTWTSDPLFIHQTGNISSIDEFPSGDTPEYRLGKDLLWFGNMEAEGSTLWNDNSDDEWFEEGISHRGNRSIAHRRTPTSGDNVVTNLEDRIKINPDYQHSLAGWIKTDNGSDVTITIRYYSSRSSSGILGSGSVHTGITGDTDWQFYYTNLTIPANANYFDIRLDSNMPDSGEALSWFDDVSVIQWTDWFPESEADYVFNPNDYYFLQLQGQSVGLDPLVTFTESVYGPAPPCSPDFTTEITGGLNPLIVPFFDISDGLVGWWEWDFGDGETSFDENPVHTYTSDGNYTVSLNIFDYTGNVISEAKSDYIHVISELLPGDVNFDFDQNILDIVIMVNIIVGEYPNPPEAVLEIGDITGDGVINVLDIILLINIILED
ncbi:MAG: CapA family protein [Candidatus Marinimicrobia bacterium]|nr:CapA family protein [Candidatus Neomarinimicrobiota bacterium]